MLWKYINWALYGDFHSDWGFSSWFSSFWSVISGYYLKIGCDCFLHHCSYISFDTTLPPKLTYCHKIASFSLHTCEIKNRYVYMLWGTTCLILPRATRKACHVHINPTILLLGLWVHIYFYVAVKLFEMEIAAHLFYISEVLFLPEDLASFTK
jgi:hypothetical protein